MTVASEIDMVRSWYFPICSNEEIDRILDVKNADDYLLKLRADAVADNIRLWRVMRYRYQINEANWNFTRHFSTVEWDMYLQALSPDDFAKCVAIPRGFLFSRETEAFCLRSDYGDLAAVSEALRYFLFFMGLALLNVDEEVPNDVRQASLLIAMRVIFQTETLDFDMDPRGIIPVSIESKLIGFVRLQLQFIIGHEFAHHLLAHHDINKTQKAHLFDSSNSHADNSLATFYTVNQEQEFEADLAAIQRPLFSKENQVQYAHAAIMFFLYLHLWHGLRDQIQPTSSMVVQTHPSPLDRLWKIATIFSPYNRTVVEQQLKTGDHFATILSDIASFDIDKLEFYGSIYLGQWRGPVLIEWIFDLMLQAHIENANVVVRSTACGLTMRYT